MKMDFVDAMRAAAQLTRDHKLVEATRVIQNTLLLGRQEVASELASEETVAGRDMIDVTPHAAMTEIATPPLSEIFATLRQGALPLQLDALARVKPRKGLRIPDGAQFLSRSFACAAGSRSYKLYVPRRRHAAPRGLLVMLHGGTQDAEDFAAGTRMNELAGEHGLLVAYPSQCRNANPSLCWNWFHPDHQVRGAGEPSIIAELTKEIVAEYGIDPRCVFVAGLSAGGAMAAVMGATYPEVYAAIGIHSGLAYKSATDVASAFAAMRGGAGLRGRQRKVRAGVTKCPRLRTIVFHGDADRIVHPSNAAKIVESQAAKGDCAERAKASSAGYTRTITRDKSGSAVVEHWLIHGKGHAWSGGSIDGSYTDPQGHDASREMLRFFLEGPRSEAD